MRGYLLRHETGDFFVSLSCFCYRSVEICFAWKSVQLRQCSWVFSLGWFYWKILLQPTLHFSKLEASVTSPPLLIPGLPNERRVASLCTCTIHPSRPPSLATEQRTHKLYVKDKHSSKSKDDTNTTLGKRERLLTEMSGQWEAPSIWNQAGHFPAQKSPRGRAEVFLPSIGSFSSLPLFSQISFGGVEETRSLPWCPQPGFFWLCLWWEHSPLSPVPSRSFILGKVCKVLLFYSWYSFLIWSASIKRNFPLLTIWLPWGIGREKAH